MRRDEGDGARTALRPGVDEAIGSDGDGIVRLQPHGAAVGDQIGREAGAIGAGGAAGDDEIARIEQQGSRPALGRPQINRDRSQPLGLLRAQLDKAAIPGTPASGDKLRAGRHRQIRSGLDGDGACLRLRPHARHADKGGGGNLNGLARGDIDAPALHPRSALRLDGAADADPVAGQGDLPGAVPPRAGADPGACTHSQRAARRDRDIARRLCGPRLQAPVNSHISHGGDGDLAIARDDGAIARPALRIHSGGEGGSLLGGLARALKGARHQHIHGGDRHLVARIDASLDDHGPIRGDGRIPTQNPTHQRLIDDAAGDHLVKDFLGGRRDHERAHIHHARSAHDHAVGIGEYHPPADDPVLIGVQNALHIHRAIAHDIDQPRRLVRHHEIDDIALRDPEDAEGIEGVPRPYGVGEDVGPIAADDKARVGLPINADVVGPARLRARGLRPRGPSQPHEARRHADEGSPPQKRAPVGGAQAASQCERHGEGLSRKSMADRDRGQAALRKACAPAPHRRARPDGRRSAPAGPSCATAGRPRRKEPTASPHPRSGNHAGPAPRRTRISPRW